MLQVGYLPGLPGKFTFGGAIRADADTLTVTDSTFTDNSAASEGGAIHAAAASITGLYPGKAAAERIGTRDASSHWRCGSSATPTPSLRGWRSDCARCSSGMMKVGE